MRCLGMLVLSREDGHLVADFEEPLPPPCQSAPLDPTRTMVVNQHGSDAYLYNDFAVLGGNRSIYGGIVDFGLDSSSEEDEEEDDAATTAEMVGDGGKEALLWRRRADRDVADANLAAGKVEGPRVSYA